MVRGSHNDKVLRCNALEAFPIAIYGVHAERERREMISETEQYDRGKMVLDPTNETSELTV